MYTLFSNVKVKTNFFFFYLIQILKKADKWLRSAYSRLQEGHCIVDCMKFEFNDII